MREISFYRAAGKIVFLLGIFEFFRHIPTNVVRGVLMLLACLITTVVAFNLSNKYENLEAKPVKVEVEDKKYNSKEK